MLSLNSNALPIHTDIVLIGGGHSHVAVLKSFGMRPEPGVRLTLIARDVLAPYSGMLPGMVAGHYTHAEAHIDLRRLCRFANARLFHAPAEAIDLRTQRVMCNGRPPVPFDWLSIDIGSTPDTSQLQMPERLRLPLKPVDEFLTAWQTVQARCQASGGDFDIVTIGAGAGGVELALSLQHRLTNESREHLSRASPRFHIISQASDILPTHGPNVRRMLRGALTRSNITLHAPAEALRVENNAVVLSSGAHINADVVVCATHAQAEPWLTGTGLELDDAGFICVNESLRSTSHERVFAVGDVASGPSPLPKSGVYAVRQGPVLAENLRRALKGKTLRSFRPQRRTLALISAGKQCAVASYGSLAVQGRWVWHLKDWIDRRWMDKYQNLPEMTEEPVQTLPGAPAAQHDGGELSAFTMRCGGCGSKVSSPVLRRVLAQVDSLPHPDVLVGLQQSDDAAVFEVPTGHLVVQSVDHFRTFIDDPYAFARITTNHCLSDLFAMGAKPHTVQVMVSLPFAPEAKIEEDLLALLTGVTASLADAGAVLVGGHTAEGPELSLGLSVNGLVRREALLTKGGIGAGDRLLLTKPLGTGVIFAADMRAIASATVVEDALNQMLLSNQRAASILLAHGAHACTDVTGFGLIGHLIEMVRASGVDVSLIVENIPLLSGAQELFQRGIRSSLHAGNATFLDRVHANGTKEHELAALLDPQTAGGLLAALPAERAEECIDKLQKSGYEASSIIGQAREVKRPELTDAARIWLT